MSIELINPEIIFALIGGAGILLIAVTADRNRKQRRAAAVNAAYVARFQVNRETDFFTWQPRRNRTLSFAEQITRANFTSSDQVETSGRGFIGRRQTLSDKSGNVVATYYEEIVLTERRQERGFDSTHRQPLLLAAAS